MQILIAGMVALVAMLHIYFLILETYFWEKPLGLKTFDTKPDLAKSSRTLAANQGLYNGFLAAGLLWSISLGNEGEANAIFFLACVIVAGIFGALTANGKILYIQAMPAMITLALILLNRP